MKGLFKSKPRSPVDIVRQTRDFLIYADRSSDDRESKREEKARKDATLVFANLQRQQVHSKLIACDYLEANIDLLDILIAGYENTDMALHYGAMLRECIRHQSIARYVLESQHVKKFFDYMQFPNFDIAADAAAIFKFFAEYNSKLLESTNYTTRRQAVNVGKPYAVVCG